MCLVTTSAKLRNIEFYKSATVERKLIKWSTVFLIADVRVAKPIPRWIKIHNFRRVDPVRLQVDFFERGYQHIVEENDTKTKSVMVTELLKGLLDEHAPETEIMVKERRTPWITDEIKHAIELRNLSYSLYNRNITGGEEIHSGVII